MYPYGLPRVLPNSSSPFFLTSLLETEWLSNSLTRHGRVRWRVSVAGRLSIDVGRLVSEVRDLFRGVTLRSSYSDRSLTKVPLINPLKHRRVRVRIFTRVSNKIIYVHNYTSETQKIITIWCKSRRVRNILSRRTWGIGVVRRSRKISDLVFTPKDR